MHRRGAPAELCISLPCAKEPEYRIPGPNKSALSIRPVVAEDAKWSILHEAKMAKSALIKWRVGDLDWDCRLSADGMEMELSGSEEVAMDLPAFEFDGRTSTCICHDATSLSIAHRGWVYRGWTCRYRTDGRIAPLGTVAYNRNGRYAAFRATGEKNLKVRIEIFMTESRALECGANSRRETEGGICSRELAAFTFLHSRFNQTER